MTHKPDLNKLVDEEIQKCLREKVREIISDKLANSTKYIEKIVIEHIDSLVPRSIEDKTIESYDVIYDNLSNLDRNDVDDAAIIYSAARMKATCNITGCTRLPSFLGMVRSKYEPLTNHMEPTLFIVKNPSEEDPSVIIKTRQKGKPVSINTIINNTCDCDGFKDNLIDLENVPTCIHLEFAQSHAKKEKICDEFDIV